MEFEPLWPMGPVYAHEPAAFPLGTDSVLLADFAAVSGARRACDLGCGGGALSVLLLARAPRLHLDGLELDPLAADACRRNLAANGWDASGIVTGDIRAHRQLLSAGAYDLVVCNPPYFARGSGAPAAGNARNAARSETFCTLEDVCAAAAYLCRTGGTFSVVYRAERLADLFCLLRAAGLEPKRMRLVAHRADAAPALVLVEGKRGARPGLKVLPSLFLTGADGGPSAEYKRIYHLEEA